MDPHLIETLEPRKLFAGVTILSHAWNGRLGGWIDPVTISDIANRVGGANQAPVYYLQAKNDVNGNPVITDLYHVPTSGTPDYAKSEVILVLDWIALSTEIQDPLRDTAECFANYIANTVVDGIRWAELPIHSISMSRGTGLIDELSRSLGRRGIWVDQETYMDPHPIPELFDQPPTIYDNVSFVDNYWRTDGNPNNAGTDGIPVNGAYNLNVQWLENHWEGYYIPHIAPTGYYVGTIDQIGNWSGEGPIYSDWYGTDGHPARDATGYLYSRIGGGTRPLVGVWAASGGTGARTATGQSGQQWPNIADITVLNGSTVASGNSIQAKYIAQDRDDASTITFYLDTDLNPYNGAMAKTLGTAALASSAAIVSPTATLATTGTLVGTYYLCAKIADGQGHYRWSYGKALTVTPAVATPPPPPAPVYLSGLLPTTSTNGWGPIENNRSNGEQGAADGKTITLAGVTYAKGLGVHAGSTIVYPLAGGYTRFNALIGIDDEVGNNGNVIFQVIADGATIFSSGALTGASATVPVDLDITGKQSISLVVLTNGDATADHADWADAKITPIDPNAPPPTPPIPPAAVNTILSTMTPISAINAWGPFENNRSNGEQGAADGKAITLNGVTYAKGIGTHAGSDISYTLGGSFKRFISDIGVDDEVGNNGSVKFQVYLDGVLAYDSGTMTGSTATKSIDVNVTGKTTLRLVVTDAGDGNASDHGDWAGAELRIDAATPPTTPTPPVAGSTTYLSALTPTNAINGYGSYEKDKSNGEANTGDGKAITLNGTTYAKGLGVHANSDITYNLYGQYARFTSDIGVDDEVGSAGSVKFQVYLDGVLAYDSGTMTGTTATKKIDLSILAKTTLRLVVTDAGNGAASDHADWANALIKAP